MAVGVNKRKRKHENISNAENDNCEADHVPKKKSKHSFKTHKDKDDHNFKEETNETSPNTKNIDPAEEEEIKFKKKLKMSSFRIKLRGDNFVTELRHFLHLAPEIVPKYLEGSGKPLEMAQAIERVDRSNVLHVGFVCEALHLILMEILGNQRQHLESAVHACRYFLKTHSTCIELLLKSPQFKHRRVALKLLTAIVCAEPKLGRHILTSFDVLNNVYVDQFLSHLHTELKQQEDENSDTVRKCFIHFVLAFLVDGNILLIRDILCKRHLIKCLISGLLYDDATTVCMVLTTMKQFVLECLEISKTTKIHVFDLNCCKSLVKLYDWYGPKVLAAKGNVIKGAKQPKLLHSDIEKLINVNEREIVEKAIHDFMLVLLTSRKYGISFDSRKYFQQKRNTIQGQLMPAIHYPWSSALKSELIIKILQSCPDLYRHTVRNFSGIINPLRYGRKFYKSVVEFLIKIIDACNPSLLNMDVGKTTLTDLTHWIKDICLPMETLVHIKGSKLLYEEKFEARLITNRLLLTMFVQYTNWIRAIGERETKVNRSGSVSALRKFKFDILNHLLLHFPTVEDILTSLNISIEQQHEDGVDVLSHLDTTLDLVLAICQDNRTFVNKTSIILDYLELLRPLYTGSDDDNVNHVDSNIQLEMKAIKTILILSPKDLEPQKERFASIMQSFIKAFVYGSQQVSCEAGNLLRNIFRNTGIFHAGELEIDLWLEPLKYCAAETIHVVSQVFTEVLKVTKANVEMPKVTQTITNIENLEQLFKNIEAGLSVQSYVETLVLSKLMHLICKGVEIEKPLGNYLESVFLLLFLYHTNPLEVATLCETQFVVLAKHMKRILREGKAFKLDIFKCSVIPKMSDVSAYIHEESSSTFENLMADQPNDEHLFMIYVQVIIFQVLQLREKQTFSSGQAEKAAEFITKALKSIESYMSPDERKRAEGEILTDKLLKYIYGVRLNQMSGQDLLETFESNINYIRFLKQMTDYCKNLVNFHTYTRNYKSKLINAVAISMRCKDLSKVNTNRLKDFLELLKVFELDQKHCIDLLNLFAENINCEDLFMREPPSFTIYYFLLAFTLERLAELQQAVECKEFIKKFVQIYQELHEKLPQDLRNLEQLEIAFYRFLLINHHYLKNMDEKLFGCFFTTEWNTNKPRIKLARLIYQRNDLLKGCLLPYLTLQQLERKELMYPLLEEAMAKNLTLDSKILQKVYLTFKAGFMRAIEKPSKAAQIYKEHVGISKKLIESGMPATECRDFCRKQFKFDGVESYQLQLIDSIYTKAFKTPSEPPEQSAIVVNFISLMISMSLGALKVQNLTYEKLQLIGFLLQKWISVSQELTAKDSNKIVKSTQWQQFCKICLKQGMEINETEPSDNELFKASLLQLLSCLCDYLMKDDQKVLNSIEFSQLFSMIFEHSKFQTIISSSINGEQKAATLQLLYVLAKECPAGLDAHQVPLILSAYHARLSKSDRFALALLNLYEIQLPQEIQQFKPFVWGETASTFYALNEKDDHLKLQQAETTMSQIMSLIDPQICEYTLENFPIWRKLNPLQQLPELIFENPLNRLWCFEGGTHVEKKIETGDVEFSASELSLCFKRNEIYNQCYDPAFMIPLMALCFAPGSSAHPARPVQNGLLALSFAALSSQDREMRLAAGCVQLRYRSHFEQSKFFEKPFWIQAYENLQSGLDELRSAWLTNKTNRGTPRVPYIPTLFVAKTFNITTEPTHRLYKQLTMYLRLKQSFNFQCIPEFNVLFYSSEVEHQEYRRFILEIIVHGVKCNSDLFLLISTNTLKVLMAFYNAPMSTLDLNLLILVLFSTCAKIPSACKLLIENVGLLPWLSTIVQSIEFHQFDVIEGVICILNNLWYSLKVQQREFHNFLYLQKEIHKIIIQLLPFLSSRISLSRFAKLMNIMGKTANEKDQYLTLSTKDLQQLLVCAEKYFDKLVLPLVAIFTFGGQECSKVQEYDKELFDSQVDSDTCLALRSLRDYLIHWSSVSLDRTETDLSIQTRADINT
uniref:Nucleolar pre-ribosomal-associated protein 1 n=1 Tax=Glossina palpalis gambiensis TaxID=67801 RepID=A0A1B0AKD4_9MUSC